MGYGKLIAVLFLLPSLSFAQSWSELERLVFEAVPLTDAAPLTFTGESPGMEAFALRASSTSARLDLPARREIENFAALIKNLEEEEGPFSLKVSEQLLSLAELYQQAGRHEEAVEALAKAEHLIRVNHGLYSLDQIPVTERMISSLLALEKIQEADDKHRYMLYLQEKFHGKESVDVVPGLIKFAHWKMGLFKTAVRYEMEGLTFGVSEQEIRNAAFLHLYEAQDTYLRAIDTLVDNQALLHPQLIPLERRLLETFYLGANKRGILSDPDNYIVSAVSGTQSRIQLHRPGYLNPFYHYGEESFERILSYQRSNKDVSPEDYARTLLEYADWDVYFGKRQSGFAKYEEAYAYLRKAGVEEEEIERIMNPAVPVALPGSASDPHSGENLGLKPSWEQEYRGFIDTAFHLSVYGNVKDIEILATSENTDDSVVKRLRRFLRQGVFRPRYSEGKPVEGEVAVRYYYAF